MRKLIFAANKKRIYFTSNRLLLESGSLADIRERIKGQDTDMTGQILVIDDDEKILRILNLLIKSFGYSPVLVDDPVKGLELLRENPPSLILLDLMMSPMNGLQFLDERRKISGALKVPVVILSAWRLNNEELAPYADSIAEVVVKPVEPARLKEVIARYTG